MALICVGLGIEIVMILAVVSGISDRLGALILVVYCIAWYALGAHRILNNDE
jgi:hypothetical protein